jgi:DNA (cytosine-5)-methyltransferase 1
MSPHDRLPTGSAGQPWAPADRAAAHLSEVPGTPESVGASRSTESGRRRLHVVPSEPAFRFIDLFAGIGGFHEALRDLGGHGVLASEVDPRARAVYADNHGLVPLGDVRDIGTHEVRDHSVLTAGFPCQAFSKAGLQEGLKDQTRGTLFYDICRIAEFQHPRFLILENVRNLATHDGGRTWSVIVGRLRQLGYRLNETPLIFSPHLLPEAEGGSPQLRERVFLLAEHRDWNTSQGSWDFHIENKALGDWNPKDWDLRAWLEARPPLEKDLSPYALTQRELEVVAAWGELAASTRQMNNLRLPQPVKEYSWRSKPLVSGLPDWKQAHNRANAAFWIENRSYLENWRERHKPKTWIKSHRKFEWQAADAARTQSTDIYELLMQFRPSGLRVKRPNYTGALVAITQTPILGWEKRRLTPSEAASLQGLPRDFCLHEKDSVAYRQLGNGVHVGVVKYLAQALFDYVGFTGAVPQSVQVRPTATVTTA